MVFTGGIGAHAAQVRLRTCEGLRFLGIYLDATRNVVGAPVISTTDSKVTVRVIPTNEEFMFARHTAQLLDAGGQAQ